MKIIDLDSWETGYADGELGRAPQCPIDSDCDPLSYSMGYREGLSSRAGTRRKAHAFATRNCQSRCVDLIRRREDGTAIDVDYGVPNDAVGS